MIDKLGRKEPRFPAEPDKIAAAKQKIAEEVAEEQALAGGVAYGMAGCASGGDILFHEVCEASWHPDPHPPGDSARAVHQGVGRARRPGVGRASSNGWSGRARCACSANRRSCRAGYADKPGYTIWQRNNLWMLYNALAGGGDNVTLIALWDGVDSGDGPGGTADMVEKARERGAKTVTLDTKEIFAL